MSGRRASKLERAARGAHATCVGPPPLRLGAQQVEGPRRCTSDVRWVGLGAHCARRAKTWAHGGRWRGSSHRRAKAAATEHRCAVRRSNEVALGVTKSGRWTVKMGWFVCEHSVKHTRAILQGPPRWGTRSTQHRCRVWTALKQVLPYCAPITASEEQQDNHGAVNRRTDRRREQIQGILRRRRCG